MKETVRTTISLPKALYDKALQKVEELHYSTFSDYVQHLLRQEVADLLPEGDPVALQLADKNFDANAILKEAIEQARQRLLKEDDKYPKPKATPRKQAIPKEKQN